MNKFRKLLNNILSAFFPDRCSVCGDVTEIGKVLCEKCSRLVYPISGRVCHKCGISVNDHNEEKCMGISAPVIAAFYYRDGVRNLIIDFKDTKSERYFDIFAPAFFERIAKEYSDVDFDIAVCVPSSDKKKSTSEIIARETAQKFFVSFDKSVLEKYRETRKQHHLSMEERFHNLENSIRVRAGKESCVKNKTVLLCDDVKSTGTTLNECVKALYNAGAKAVFCACIAVSDYGIK